LRSGRKEHIHNVIDKNEQDYSNLNAYPEDYPAHGLLRSIWKQGAIDIAEYKKFLKVITCLLIFAHFCDSNREKIFVL